MYIKDGIELTPEDVAYNASIAGVSPEQWVEENEFNTVEETDPPKEGKLIGPTVETQLPGPVTEATAGVSSSVDTSLESQEPVLGRFIQVDGGLVYEDYYNKNLAGKKTGKGNYPSTFEEYADTYNAKIETEETFPTMLEEAEVVADKVVTPATPFLEKLASINKDTEKESILASYFYLKKDSNGDYGFDLPQEILEQYGDAPAFSQEGGPSTGYTPNIEAVKIALGPEKFNQWSANIGNAVYATPETLNEVFDVNEVDDATISKVLDGKRTTAMEALMRSLSDEEIDEVLDEAISLDPEYQQAVNEAWKYANNVVGFSQWGTRSQSSSSVFNPRDLYTDLLKNEFKDLKQHSEAFKGAEQFLQQSIDKFEADKKNIETRANELFKNLEAKKKAVEGFTVVPGINQNSIDAINSAQNAYKGAVDEYNAFISSEEAAALAASADDLIASQTALEYQAEWLSERYANLVNTTYLQNAALKNYNKLDLAGQALEEGILGTAVGFMGMLAQGATYLSFPHAPMPEAIEDYLLNFKGRTVQYNIDLNEKRVREFPAKAKFAQVSKGDISLWDYAGESLMNGAPSILAVMGPQALAYGTIRYGGRKVIANQIRKMAMRATMTSFYIQETGGDYMRSSIAQKNAGLRLVELNEQLENAVGGIDKINLQEQIDIETNNLNRSEFTKIVSANSKGLIATYAEKFGTLRTISNFQRYSAAIGRRQLSNSMIPFVRNNARFMAAGIGTAKGVAYGVPIELFEEGFTLVGHNLVDIELNGISKSILEGLDVDFAVDVVLPTLAIMGPSAMGNIGSAIQSELLTREQAAKATEIRNEIHEIQDAIDGLDGRTKSARALGKRKTELFRDLNLLDAEVLIKAGQLDKADFKILTDLNREISLLQKDIAEIGAAGKITQENRAEFERLKAEVEQITSNKEDILRKPEEAIRKEAEKAGLEAEGILQFSQYSANVVVAKGFYGDNFVEIKEEADIENLPKDIKEAAREAYSKGDLGAFVKGKAVVFKERVLAAIQVGGDLGLFAAPVPIHEIGHGEVAKSKPLVDKGIVGLENNMVQSVLNEMERLAETGGISAATLETFKARFDQYLNIRKDGKVDADELIQLISDLDANGLLPPSSFDGITEIKGVIRQIMSTIMPQGRTFFKLESYKDVRSFLSSWQRKAFGGARANTLPKEEESSETKESIGQKTLLGDINALVPESVETQDQFFDRKVFNPIYNEGKLHPSIANYIRSRSVSKEEAQKIIESVSERLINFNPAAKRKSGDAKITLGEFIFSNVNFGKLDARKALFEEGQERAQTESTDSETAKQVVAKEESAPAAIEKPKYKTLTKRRVLSEEAKSTAEAKVLSNVRVLKSRIDAKVGKNVTVTPLIAEIKKTLGKQLDIDFKKEMGGKKDGQLRKYLLRNKAAILENMTTTWLMTAMPNAVQKQVDGVWTSDWKGKKIDREAVTTDSAGRTSGAELVRRLPKAAARLSDADYLSNVLDESGAPIRGRKESLAKAMAEQYAIETIQEGVANLDSEIGKAFFDNQARKGVEITETTAVELNRQAEQGNVKFSLGLGAVIEYLENPKFNINLGNNHEKGINKLLILHGKDTIFKLDSKEDINSWAESTTEYVLPLLPKDIFFSKDKKGNYKESGSSAFRRSNRFVGEESLDDYFVNKINEMRALPESAFAPAIKGLDKKFSPSYDTNIGKDDAIMQANMDNGQVEQFNNYWGTIHRVMWQNINKAIKANPDNNDVLKAIGNYMSNVSNDKSHPHKMGAEFVGYSMDAVGKTSDKGTFRKYEWEHAMPATNAYLYLLDASINGFDFDAAYNAVMANYKLIALDTAQDLKIKAAGLSNGMPIGWKLTENNWTERYSESGVDLNTIMTTSGITLQQAINSRAANQFNSEINTEALEKAKQDIKDTEKQEYKPSLGLSKEFNNILERKTGVESFKTFSAVQAQKRGEKKGKFKFFVAPSVDDFRGLVNYAFAGKGKQGEADMKWLEDSLMTPYAKGVAAINGIRQQIKRDFKTAVKAFPKQYQLLNKEIGKTGFNYDQAVRVYLWGKAGIKVPGLSQKDTKILQDAIRENPELMEFADAMLVVARRDTWMEPSEYWSASTLLSDLNSMTEKIGRKKYLEEFIANADAIFTTENLNKIEALYGKAHRDAIEDSLYSMKNGTNRNAGGNKQVNAWLNWINGSTGAIMFFNRRSALLQMLSTVNFINYSDNNPLKAAAAFANQPQYWKDWAMIFNSDKLKERRGGLKQDVSSNEIASIANANKNSPQAILARLLQLGFTPTQIADSMAIASGGATFYRNRVNTYIKEGMSKKEAEEKAFLDFSKISDETQQSSDPALVSQVQRSNLGRLVFAFQNTPMQMTRLMKKDALDIINGRGDWRAKVARITYYGAIQNFVFASLQSALFALLPGFDDDDEDLTAAELEKKNAKEEAKIARVLNSMLDTLLRGSGVYGAVFSTVKNIIREYNKQEEKGFMANHAYTVLSLFDISPPIGSKARKVHSAIQTRKFEKDEIEARGWGVVADGRLDLGPNWSILGKVLSAAASVPLDRVVDELTSVSEAFDARNKAWQRIALGLGWKTWDVGAIEENAEAIKEVAKKERKEAGVKKAKETRAKTKNKNRNTRNTSKPRNTRTR
jgi:hypothetical protein